MTAKQPPPRKPATKTCDKGHRQAQRWKPENGCTRCAADRREAARDPAAERRRWAEELGAPPAAMIIRTGDGKAIVHAIPKGLVRRRRPR